MTIRNYERMPGHWARRFQQIAVAAFQAEMDAIGCDITPVQYVALEAIALTPSIDQATLAGEIAFDRTTITGVIDRLERKGLISRAINAKDRRARELEITSLGKTFLKKIRPGVDRAQRQMTRGLTGNEAAELLRLMQTAVEAANKISRVPKKG
jgi:MarR family transcriptional regulator, temperature-dependent positive regulator of motility